MALTVTYASTCRDLTTTGAVKALALAGTTSTARDAHIANLIRRGSMFAETFIGQPLTVQTYRETVPGFGRRSIMLSRTPIRVIKAIYDATDTGSATAIATSDYIVSDADVGLLSRAGGFAWTAPYQYGGGGVYGGDAIPLAPEPMSGQESRPWLVDYIAGYTYDGVESSSVNASTEGKQIVEATSTGRTLPEDIEMGVIESAQAMFDNSPGISSESLGDVSVSYNARSGSSDGQMDRPGASWLAPYRRIV